jgi:hypothetical protein
MHSLRSHEGEIEINHRYSPGVPEEILIALGIPKEAGKKDSVFRCATFTCADCQTIVYVNPKRNRPRGYCPKCDHYLCDECEAIRFQSGGVCRNFKNMMDQVLDALGRTPKTTETFSTSFGSSALLLP